MAIGDQTKLLRREAGLTQSELARRAGVGLRFVRELEHGKQNRIAGGDLLSLAAYLRIPAKPSAAIFQRMQERRGEVEQLIMGSLLPADQRERAVDIFRERSARVFG